MNTAIIAGAVALAGATTSSCPTSCCPDNCVTNPDADGSGRVTIRDLLTYIDGWFQQTTPDISLLLDFLDAWFQGDCCIPAPQFVIPRAMAADLQAGTNIRMLILGDSLNLHHRNDVNGENSSLYSAIHNEWLPTDGFRWINLAMSVTTVLNSRGFEARNGSPPDIVRTNIGNMELTTLFPDGQPWSIGPAISWQMDNDIAASSIQRWRVNEGTLGAFNPATTRLAQEISQQGGNLHINYWDHASMVAPANGLRVEVTPENGAPFIYNVDLGPYGVEPGWRRKSINIGGAFPADFDPQEDFIQIVARFETNPGDGAQAILQGMNLESTSNTGMGVCSVAKGGWRTTDHLRTAQNGGFVQGYTDESLRSHYQMLEFDEPGITPVILAYLGTNIATGESAGGQATDVYRSNIRAVIQRHRDALNAIGASDPYVLLVNPPAFPDNHPFSANYNESFRMEDTLNYTLSRGDVLFRAFQEEDPERVGFVDLAELTGMPGLSGMPLEAFHLPTITALTSDWTPGDTTMFVTSTTGFRSSGGHFIVIQPDDTFIEGSYDQIVGNELRGVTLDAIPQNPPTYPAGSTVGGSFYDAHPSLMGSRIAARAIWDAIVDQAVNGPND